MTDQLNLANLFQSVTERLGDNKKTLNQADDYNQNHGDNMVEIFDVITKAMEERSDSDHADQLAHASKLLERKKSGSAQMYSKGLSQAAEQFKGQGITANNATGLVQMLLGGGQAEQPSVGNLMGSLLGGGQSEQSSEGDLLGSLLGGLVSDQGTTQGEGGLDMSDLLEVGSSLLQAKGEGDSGLGGLVEALVSNSQMGQSSHRAQSSTIVADSLFKIIGSITNK
jgi:hypothetical protein